MAGQPQNTLDIGSLIANFLGANDAQGAPAQRISPSQALKARATPPIGVAPAAQPVAVRPQTMAQQLPIKPDFSPGDFVQTKMGPGYVDEQGWIIGADPANRFEVPLAEASALLERAMPQPVPTGAPVLQAGQAPSIAQTFKQNMEDAISRTAMGAVQRAASNETFKADPTARFENYNQRVDPKFERARRENLDSQRTEYGAFSEKGGAPRVLFEDNVLTPGRDPVLVQDDLGRVLTQLSAFLGGTAGALSSPENLVATGANAPSAVARILQQGAIGGGTDVIAQTADKAAGVQDKYDPMQTVAAAGTGAGLQGVGEGIARAVGWTQAPQNEDLASRIARLADEMGLSGEKPQPSLSGPEYSRGPVQYPPELEQQASEIEAAARAARMPKATPEAKAALAQLQQSGAPVHLSGDMLRRALKIKGFMDPANRTTPTPEAPPALPAPEAAPTSLEAAFAPAPAPSSGRRSRNPAMDEALKTLLAKTDGEGRPISFAAIQKELSDKGHKVKNLSALRSHAKVLKNEGAETPTRVRYPEIRQDVKTKSTDFLADSKQLTVPDLAKKFGVSQSYAEKLLKELRFPASESMVKMSNLGLGGQKIPNRVLKNPSKTGIADALSEAQKKNGQLSYLIDTDGHLHVWETTNDKTGMAGERGLKVKRYSGGLIRSAEDIASALTNTKNARKRTALATPEYALGKPSGQGGTVETVTEGIHKAWGRDAKKLLDSGRVEVVRDIADLPPLAKGDYPDDVRAVYDRARGKAYVVASRVSPEDAKGVILHEIGEHHGLADMIGKDRYGALQKQMRALKDADARVSEAYKEASGKADARRVDSEAIAYMLEKHPDSPQAKPVLKAVREWFNRTFGADLQGSTFKRVKSFLKADEGADLGVDDIRELAVASLRRSADNAGKAPKSGPIGAPEFALGPELQTPEARRMWADKNLRKVDSGTEMQLHDDNWVRPRDGYHYRFSSGGQEIEVSLSDRAQDGVFDLEWSLPNPAKSLKERQANPLRQDSALLQKLMGQVMATVEKFARDENPEQIHFLGANESLTKLYSWMLNKFTPPGYTSWVIQDEKSMLPRFAIARKGEKLDIDGASKLEKPLSAKEINDRVESVMNPMLAQHRANMINDLLRNRDAADDPQTRTR